MSKTRRRDKDFYEERREARRNKQEKLDKASRRERNDPFAMTKAVKDLFYSVR